MNALNLIYFSPTGTTRKIVKTIGHNCGIEVVKEVDFTQLEDTNFNLGTIENELTIIGLPVYGGRVPAEILPKLEQLQAKNAPVVLVVVYGNRDFDDALLELKDIVEKCGFRVVAASAFVGEHSYSTKYKSIAAGRPDENDLLKCKDFAQKINEQIHSFYTNYTFSHIELPGNYPYKERKQKPLISPETITENCDECGICATVCPTNAIVVDGGVKTDKSLCIWCCACVKSCPKYARHFSNSVIDEFKNKLSALCSERKEPEFFF